MACGTGHAVVVTPLSVFTWGLAAQGILFVLQWWGGCPGIGPYWSLPGAVGGGSTRGALVHVVVLLAIVEETVLGH